MNVSEFSTLKPNDLRAPLASFDTVDFDFGEDRSTVPTLHTGEDKKSVQSLKDDSFEQKSEVDSTNSETSTPFEYCAFPDDSNDPFNQELKQDQKLEDVWSNITVESSPKQLIQSKVKSFEYHHLKDKRTTSSSSSSDDSFSSDSECGYIKSGYVTVTSNSNKFSDYGFPCENFDSPLPQRHFLKHVGDNNSSCDSTPFSSPNLSRSALPHLLKELDTVTEKSKRKALEKRIQRLQVTNKPVERPRSTTPINVVNFEEYKPEDSPSLNSEKLSIKLPPEEFHKKHHKSPFRHHGDVFNFSLEDQLFTRTKSLVVEAPCKPGQSPKRVLIPPSLTPSCSPLRKKSDCQIDNEVFFSTSPDKWVAFPDNTNANLISKTNNSDKGLTNENNHFTGVNNRAVTAREDVLTISILERDNSKMCEISLDDNNVSDRGQLEKQINTSGQVVQVDNDNSHAKDNVRNDSDTSDLRKEILSIVNEIFDTDTSLPQVFQDEDDETDKQLTSTVDGCAKDETNTHSAHLLQL